VTGDRTVQWDSPSPFTLQLIVANEEIDDYQHVNNAAYVRWLDRCAWAHSTALGVSIEDCKRIDRGMAVLRSEIDYLAPAFLNERITIATWIVQNDGKLRVSRKFQIVADHSGQTLVRATVNYVCLILSSGRPARMPPVFLDKYGATL
jgi:acyl-CoA thioester hydrolase